LTNKSGWRRAGNARKSPVPLANNPAALTLNNAGERAFRHAVLWGTGSGVSHQGSDLKALLHQVREWQVSGAPGVGP
jgi:hypothetical protein